MRLCQQPHDIHKDFQTAFNQVRRWKYIQKNPFVDADVPDYKSTERPALSPKEFEKILEYTDEEKTLHIYKALDRVDKKNLDLPKLVIYYAFPVLNPYNKTVTVLKAPKTEATERFSKLNNLLIGKLDRLKTMQAVGPNRIW